MIVSVPREARAIIGVMRSLDVNVVSVELGELADLAAVGAPMVGAAPVGHRSTGMAVPLP
jgi:hypothetical protein